MYILKNDSKKNVLILDLGIIFYPGEVKDLDLHFNQYTKLNEYIISGYNELYDFLDKFKIKKRLEDNSYYNRISKFTKI